MMDNQELKIIMTWQYALACHHSHVGGRNDIDNLTPTNKDSSAGAGLYSGGPLEGTFLLNYKVVSDFVDRVMPKLAK